MPVRHVIVDGSNLATEGRSLPSLAQLDQAVREFLAENPNDVVTVVVDASFGHRIDTSEVAVFEEAEAAGEVVSPPAGAIGRGDAFLLRIAEKTGATVLSNDSFQEFHGEHVWLFDDGRLIGGKPVPGVGWIFMPRTPVRGQKSREVVKEAKRKKRAEDTVDGAEAGTGLDLALLRSKGRAKKVDRAIARATEEAVEPKAGSRPRRRPSTLPPAEPVNEPLAFIRFIAAHPLGSEVMGTVAEFSSHGAFVEADGARCYLPLSAMGDPPPRRAREVVGKGEERSFVVQALDPQRRGIELALPGFAHIAGRPTEETVDAEIHPQAEAPPKRRRGQKAAPAPLAAVLLDGPAGPAEVEGPVELEAAGPPAPVKVAAGTRRAAAKKAAAAPPAPPAKKAGLKKAAAAQKAAGGEVLAGAKVAAGRKATPPGEKAAPSRKAAATGEKTTAGRKATAAGGEKSTTARKVAGGEKAAGTKATAVKKAAAAAKPAGPSGGVTAGDETPAKRARAVKAAAPARKSAAAKAPAQPGDGSAPRRAGAKAGAAPAGEADTAAATVKAARPSRAKRA